MHCCYLFRSRGTSSLASTPIRPTLRAPPPSAAPLHPKDVASGKVDERAWQDADDLVARHRDQVGRDVLMARLKLKTAANIAAVRPQSRAAKHHLTGARSALRQAENYARTYAHALDDKERQLAARGWQLALNMLDVVRVRRDIPGTDLKAGMRGTMVEIVVDHAGGPVVGGLIEVIDPQILADVSIDDIEVVWRA